MTEEPMTRRHFLNTVSAVALGLLGSAAAALAGGFLYPIKRRKQPAQFICMDSEIPSGGIRAIQDLSGKTVLLMRKSDDRLVAISTVCTHLGCTAFYRPSKQIFECPCHQGVFDADGNVVSGPPQTPLKRFPVTVRNNMVFVDFA